MKCPHCNQEHPAGTIFCPFTGERIAPAMKSCPNPRCNNYGKLTLPLDYLYCPHCNASLSVGNTSEVKTEDRLTPEKRYKIIILSANENLIPEIDRIAGTDFVGYTNALRLFPRHEKGRIFPHALYEEKIVESRAIVLKSQLEAIGVSVELQRLNSSTVADFESGHIFVDNVSLGETQLDELLTPEYKNRYKENLDECLEEEVIKLTFELSEGIVAGIMYPNPQLDNRVKSEIRLEYFKLFTNPSDANFSFVENRRRVVNYMEVRSDEMPLFTELGCDDDLLLNDDNSDQDIDAKVTEILQTYGWERIPDFLLSNNPFTYENTLASFRCLSKSGMQSDEIYLTLLGEWYNFKALFTINILKAK